MKHIDLFSGIGGFALATEIVWDNVEHMFCDNEPFAQAILKKHWPNAQIYGDIRQLKGNISEPYILTGGFPCQPFSHAGVRRGTADDRYLWPEMLRVISEFRPRWVIAENVSGLLSIQNGMVFEQVCADLENEGYEVWPFVIPACAVGAPHRRDRVWIVAHANDERRNHGLNNREERRIQADQGIASESEPKRQGRKRRTRTIGTNAPDTRRRYGDERGESVRPERIQRESEDSERLSHRDKWRENWLEVATRLCRVDDGVPRRLDRTGRLKALGNAIVPQVAAAIMNGIKHTDNLVQ